MNRFKYLSVTSHIFSVIGNVHYVTNQYSYVINHIFSVIGNRKIKHIKTFKTNLSRNFVLEERLKPEVKNRLHNIYTRGQILLNSGLVQEGFSYQKALEDFYDLEWGSDYTTWYIGDGGKAVFSHEYGLQRKPENSERLQRTPTDLVSTLDRFSDTRILGNIINNERELTYEKVRASYRPDLSDVERACWIKFNVSSLGLITSLVSTFYSVYKQDLVQLNWTVPLFVVSMVGVYAWGTLNGEQRAKLKAERKRNENLPPEIKKRKEAFWRLHELSKEADALLKEYKQYFN